MSSQPRSQMPAFKDLQDRDQDGVSLWVNKTLLPDLAHSLQNHRHPSLLDLSTACTEVFRGREEEHGNEHCSIIPDNINSTNGGAFLSFTVSILDSASQALMDTPNAAVAKIGYELRNAARRKQKGPLNEIRFRGGRPYFLAGVNTNAQAATLVLTRSALIEIVNDMGGNSPLRQLFNDIAEVLDPEADEVNDELDDTTVATDEGLMRLQG